jgi:hypothetical protein
MTTRLRCRPLALPSRSMACQILILDYSMTVSRVKPKPLNEYTISPSRACLLVLCGMGLQTVASHERHFTEDYKNFNSGI